MDSWVGLFAFFLRRAAYGGFVYLAFPHWALGVNDRPRGTAPGSPGGPDERYVSVKWRNCDRNPGFYGPMAMSFVPLPSPPIYGGFVYIAAPRLAFGR